MFHDARPPSLVRRLVRRASNRLIKRASPEVVGAVRSALARGDAVECPCCESSFRAFSAHRDRPGARCPRCGALERHRLLWLFLCERTNLLTDHLEVLHVAPEYMLQRRLVDRPNLDYLSIDLDSRFAAMRADVTNLPFNDASFDVIFCNHVLEHVSDDRQAMRELRRVLRPGGWGVMLSPVEDRDDTFEDPSVVSPADRMRVFGQEDHVRIYGHDYRDRLREAGFTVAISDFVDELDEARIVRHGLRRRGRLEDIFICERPA